MFKADMKSYFKTWIKYITEKVEYKEKISYYKNDVQYIL